jgi:transposase
MQPGYRRCCGIDVHRDQVTVTVLPPVGRTEVRIKKQEFRTFTRNLKRLRAWLLACRVTEVAMESTGQYWLPVWNILEGSIPKMLLLNPLHVKALEGKKTDAIDSERIGTLLQNHELRGSFVPPREIRELRELLRQRVHLLQEINRVKNRAEGVCQSGNVKVSSVATNVFGMSGRLMLEGIVEGKRSAAWMADYACTRLRSRKAELELALEGTFTEHQRSLLAAHLRHLKWLEEEVASVEQEVSRRVEAYKVQLERLDAIPGVDSLTAWTMLAELGPDASAFADDKHAASWTGLCPGNHESGGKRQSGRTGHGNRYLRRALCQAARAAARSKGTYPAALYRRMLPRMGDQAAIIAVAHWMLVVAYHILRDSSEYYELGGNYFDELNKPKVVRRLLERLHRLGYRTELTELGAEAPAPISTQVEAVLTEIIEKKGSPAG